MAETRHRRETQRLAWAAKKAMYVKRPAREVIDQPDVRTTNTSACPLTDTCSQRDGCMSAAEAPGSMCLVQAWIADSAMAEHWGLGSQHAAGCLMTPSAEQGNMLTGQEAELCPLMPTHAMVCACETILLYRCSLNLSIQPLSHTCLSVCQRQTWL